MTSFIRRWAITPICLLCVSGVATAQIDRGLAESKTGTNRALMVGVSHGLPGIDIDVKNATAMATDPEYAYTVDTMMDKQGTTKAVKEALTDVSARAGITGSLFFYYSGHGSKGSIYLQDRSLGIKEIRSAIEEGRKNLPPLPRLVMMFDSCYSGSLLDPLRLFLTTDLQDEKKMSEEFADSVVNEMMDSNRDGNYWEKLFVFASSRADETSLAGKDGSVFTVALKKAFDETVKSNATMGDFIAKTKEYTKGHHPVERLVPATMAQEKMHP